MQEEEYINSHDMSKDGWKLSSWRFQEVVVPQPKVTEKSFKSTS